MNKLAYYAALLMFLAPEATFAGQKILHFTFDGTQRQEPPIGVTTEALTKATDSISVDCSVARKGICSSRTTLANSKDYISFGAHRAESQTINLVESRYSAGEKIRYRFSLMLNPDWEIDNRDSIDIIWQFKRLRGEPDMFVAVKGRDIVLRITGNIQHTLVKNYPIGAWLDFLFDVSWSASADGEVLAAVRLAPKSDYSKLTIKGANMRNAIPKNAYVKWGIYKPDYAKTSTYQPRIVFHDEISIEILN